MPPAFGFQGAVGPTFSNQIDLNRPAYQTYGSNYNYAQSQSNNQQVDQSPVLQVSFYKKMRILTQGGAFLDNTASANGLLPARPYGFRAADESPSHLINNEAEKPVRSKRSTHIDVVQFVATASDIPQPRVDRADMMKDESSSKQRRMRPLPMNQSSNVSKTMDAANASDNSTLDVISEPVFVADNSDLGDEDAAADGGEGAMGMDSP